MGNSRMSLSMITFFYNEEDYILDYLQTVVSKFEGISRKVGCKYEIVMVDDGSTDDSRSIVEGFMSENPNASIILHSYDVNRGIGHALVQGLKLCSYDYVFWNDVDMHFDISDLAKIIPHLDQNTIVVGYKTNILYKRFVPWFVSRTNYYLLKILFYPGIKDFQFVQFYPREYVRRTEILSRSSLIPCELLTRSKDEYRIKHVPLYYTSPGDERHSKCVNLKTISCTLRDILRLRLWMLK
jgi:glycosyltransferase involved in cell wall biosynthesis